MAETKRGARKLSKPIVTVEKLRELVMHMYIHSGYRDCGYDKMTREQRDLYLFVTDRQRICDECGQPVAYAEDEKAALEDKRP